MPKIVRLTEADLTRLVNRIIKEQSQGPISVQGSTLDDLRNKLKAITNVSINPSSVKVDLNQKTVSFQPGNIPVKSLSIIFDDRNDLKSRLPQIKSKNPTMKVALQGQQNISGPTPQDIQYAVVYFE